MCSLRYLSGRTLSPFPAEAGQVEVAMVKDLKFVPPTVLSSTNRP
jgi:hypothetical protein